MFKKNKNLLIIALIAVVNALGYGIIIPIMFSYGQRFGLTVFENGLLFSVFSICQFIATPIIGRLSDAYGRKPLLIISILGTAVSFLLMAFARSSPWLFVARALDGLTAGNISVASAVISDTTAPADRAKGFGIIGASFGFGFTFGPAISALTLRFGDTVPFLIAAFVSIGAAILTWIVLPETNIHKGKLSHGKLFDLGHLVGALFDKKIGATLLLTFLYSLAFAIFFSGFQPLALNLLAMTDQQISVLFTGAGIMGFVAQAVIIPRSTKRLGESKALTASLLLMCGTFFSFFLVRSAFIFGIITIVNSLANAFVQPLTQALLSKEVDMKSQGTILGINASYMSLGMIFGPIVGGFIATFFLPLPFLVGSLIFVVCTILSIHIGRKIVKPLPVF